MVYDGTLKRAAAGKPFWPAAASAMPLYALQCGLADGKFARWPSFLHPLYVQPHYRRGEAAAEALILVLPVLALPPC